MPSTIAVCALMTYQSRADDQMRALKVDQINRCRLGAHIRTAALGSTLINRRKCIYSGHFVRKRLIFSQRRVWHSENQRRAATMAA